MNAIDCDKNSYAYDDQTLVIVIFDCPVKFGNGSTAYFVEAPEMRKVFFLERASKNCQLYLAHDLGMKDHFTCPTFLCYELIRCTRSMAKLVQFTFIKGTCTEYRSDTFSMISLDPDSEITQHLKRNVRKYIRYSTEAFNYTADPK